MPVFHADNRYSSSPHSSFSALLRGTGTLGLAFFHTPELGTLKGAINCSSPVPTGVVRVCNHVSCWLVSSLASLSPQFPHWSLHSQAHSILRSHFLGEIPGLWEKQQWAATVMLCTRHSFIDTHTATQPKRRAHFQKPPLVVTTCTAIPAN